MKEIDKQSIFWYGLYKVVHENEQLKYYITTQKELIFNLYPIVFVGVTQYVLYKGIAISEISIDKLNTYTDYIIANYDEIYKIKFRFVNDKPPKINFDDEKTKEVSREIISGLLLPYINKFCFKTYEQWKNLYKSYIRECAIKYEYDINHQSEDGGIKTSIAYPFIFTLNLIKIFDTQGLYQRIQKCYQKDFLLKKFNSGRVWKQKELKYLQETYELIQNDEEWLMFLSNFSSYKWNNFSLKERFKGLFQLTKLTTILMKEEISSITMLDNGTELYELIEFYLPLFIYSDKIKDSNEVLIEKYRNSKVKILSPFSHQNINFEALIQFISSKGDRFVEISEKNLEISIEIIFYVFANLRLLLLIHEYLPQVVNSRINSQKKLFADVLKLFEEVEKGQFKRKVNVENLLENDFFISEEEILDIIGVKLVNLKDLEHQSGLIKLGKIASLMLGIETKTASIMNYELKELVKNILVIFGPHPLDRTIQTEENINIIYEKFTNICFEYEKLSIINSQEAEKFTNCLELPLKLFNWKKD